MTERKDAQEVQDGADDAPTSSEAAAESTEAAAESSKAAAESTEAAAESSKAAADAPAGEDPGRRRALGTIATAGGAVYAAAVLAPSYCFVDQPKPAGTKGERFLRVARFDSLPDGKPAQFKVRGDHRDAYTISRDQTLGLVWLHRKGKAVTAMSAECPHLGCAISLEAKGESYNCPCHVSRFSLEGKSESGPSPRAMDTLPARVVEGWVEVDFARFRQGVTTKEKLA